MQYVSIQTKCLKTEQTYEYVFCWSEKRCLEIYEIIEGVHFSVFHYQPQSCDIAIEKICTHQNSQFSGRVGEIRDFFYQWIENSMNIRDQTRF